MAIGTEQIADSTSTSATPTQPTGVSSPPIVTITAHHHIPVKFTATTYSPWRANFLAMLNDFDLTGHIDGRRPLHRLPIRRIIIGSDRTNSSLLRFLAPPPLTFCRSSPPPPLLPVHGQICI
ncbi:hypothetical protein ACS0TY_028053 [Phlomoides rotata]